VSKKLGSCIEFTHRTIINTDGIANANINSSRYLFMSAEIGVVVADDLVRFLILSPKINDDAPNNKRL
jgi:hypothetical protein